MRRPSSTRASAPSNATPADTSHAEVPAPITTVDELRAYDALHGALRRHMSGGFSFERVALALVREGWRISPEVTT